MPSPRFKLTYVFQMSRDLINPTPRTFDELQGAHQSLQDLEKARRVMKKFVPGDLVFQLWSVPVHELIESGFVEAILREQIPPDDYAGWLQAGAPRRWLFDAYGQVFAHRREHEPEWAAEQAIVDALTTIYATGRMDPLIGARMESALSTGEKAVFIIDGRHRLYAACAAKVPNVEVYIGRDVAETRLPVVAGSRAHLPASCMRWIAAIASRDTPQPRTRNRGGTRRQKSRRGALPTDVHRFETVCGHGFTFKGEGVPGGCAVCVLHETARGRVVERGSLRVR